MLGVEPGLPELSITLKPETAPDSACAGLECTPTVKASLFTFEIELVTLVRNCLPP